MTKFISKIMLPVLVLLTVFSASNANAAWPFGDDEKRISYLIINDNDVLYPAERELYEQVVFKVMEELMADRERSASKNHTVVIILTSNGLTPFFEGSPQELYESADYILEAATTVKPNANDLIQAYTTVVDHTELQSSDELKIDISHIGPWFHIGLDYDGSEELAAPKAIDGANPLGAFLTNDFVTSYRAFMVIPPQVKMVNNYLSNNGVRKHGEDGFVRMVSPLNMTAKQFGLFDFYSQVQEEHKTKATETSSKGGAQ